jgi:hypothetical protein
MFRLLRCESTGECVCCRGSRTGDAFVILWKLTYYAWQWKEHVAPRLYLAVVPFGSWHWFAARLRLVQFGSNAGNGRQLWGIWRYGRARHVAGIIGEAWRGKVLGALRRRGQWIGGRADDRLGRCQARGSALCVAWP